MEYMLDFEKATAPVWYDGGEAYCEPALAFEGDDGEVFVPLYYKPDSVLLVAMADLSAEFCEGRDYRVCENGIIINKNGSVPYMTKGELYPAEKSAYTFGGRNGIPYIIFGEGHFFHDKQITVTYRHSESWRGPVPKSGGVFLPGTRAKLSEGRELSVLIYGDSIAAGGNASGCTGAPPYQKRFGELFCEMLEKGYGCKTRVINTAVGGTASEWGLAEAEMRAKKYGADLNIIAFGMNDGSGHVPPEKFKANIEGIIGAVRSENKNAEFLLVTSILPNTEACLFGLQESYPEVLWEISGEGVFVADIMPVHRELLAAKRYIDLTGNNVNHPNDYMHRVYAAVLYKALK